MDALSLACNIITVIDFGHTLFEVSQEIYRTGKPDPDATSSAKDLFGAAKDLENSINAGTQPICYEESELLRIANSCRETARKLGEAYKKLSVSKSGHSSRFSHAITAIGAGIKQNWQKHKLEDLDKAMKGYETAMQTRILVYFYKSRKAQDAIGQQEFSNLNFTLQNFIRAVSEGKFGMADLLTKVDDLHALQLGTRNDIHTIQMTNRNDQMRDRFMASLKFDGMNQRFNHDVRDAHHETFKWLFGENIDPSVSPGGTSGSTSDNNLPRNEHSEWEPDYIQESRNETFDDFGKWLTSDSGLYWISGKAGAGKSTLMKFICQHMTTTKPTPDSIVLYYFFWFNAPASTMQRSISGMLSTLLYQLLQHDQDLFSHLMNTIPEARLKDKDSPSDWNCAELELCLLAALRFRKTGNPVYIFIDGLDEVLKADGPSELLRVIRKLEKLRDIRLCVSSRPELVFYKDLGHSKHLRLEKLTAPDIHHFVLDFLQPWLQTSSPNIDTDAIRRFIEVLVLKSEGVFLWARVATQSLLRGLNDGNSIEKLKERLEATPSDLNGLFASMWKRLGDDEQVYRTEAANIFQLLLCNGEVYLSHCLGKEYDDYLDLLTLHLALDAEKSVEVIQNLESMHKSPDLVDHDILPGCEGTFKMILSRCVGLVEVDSKPDAKTINNCTDPGKLTPPPACHVRFVHRTASEFLENTPEGQKILGSHSLGKKTPLFRLYLACIARATFFRGVEYSGKYGLISKELVFHIIFGRCRDHRLRVKLSDKEMHEILELIHIIHNQSFGDSTNSQFAGWTRRGFGYPFIILTAMYGMGHYLRQMVKQLPHDINNALVALMLSEFAGAIFLCGDGILPPEYWEDYLATLEHLLNLCPETGHNQPGVFLDGVYLGLRYFDYYTLKLITPFRNLLRIFEHISRDDIPTWHNPQACDTILKALRLFASSGTNLHQRFIGSYWPEITVHEDSCVPWHSQSCMRYIDSSLTYNLPPRCYGALIETNALWGIQLMARTHEARFGSSLLAKELLNFVADVSGDKPLPGPRALLLLSSVGDMSRSDCIYKGKIVPRDLETHILDPLTSNIDSIEKHTWLLARDNVQSRIDDCWEHGTVDNKVLTMNEIREFLIAQGELASKETAKTMYEACGITVPTNFFEHRWPGEASSDNDEASSDNDE
ncbi:hypothetical protein NHQ30_002607 [Ciborinia camelliae]|nr:hypothetical protein NHQ30_002607 [Ciborinia camelliae]